MDRNLDITSPKVAKEQAQHIAITYKYYLNTGVQLRLTTSAGDTPISHPI